MNCLDCKKCVPAKKWLYVKNGINYGFRQLYVCKDKHRYIAKKYFERFPIKDGCFKPKVQTDLM